MDGGHGAQPLPHRQHRHMLRDHEDGQADLRAGVKHAGHGCGRRRAVCFQCVLQWPVLYSTVCLTVANTLPNSIQYSTVGVAVANTLQ